MANLVQDIKHIDAENEADGAYSSNKQEAMHRLNNVVDAGMKNGIDVIIDGQAHE